MEDTEKRAREAGALLIQQERCRRLANATADIIVRESLLNLVDEYQIEIEALSQGFLFQTIVDSFDVQRFLQDNEEFWPFEGEDWEDEYVGGEGLR